MVAIGLGPKMRTAVQALKEQQEERERENKRLNKIRMMRRGAIPHEMALWLR